VNRRDVRMVERGQDLGFPLEASEPIRIGREEIRENLQRDIPLQARIPRAIDLPL